MTTRRWLIKNDIGLVVDEVRGEGVIGLFPVVSPNMKSEVVYQSCTQQKTERGSMEGEFGFVRLVEGVEDEFLVQCGRFDLEVPSFIY